MLTPPLPVFRSAEALKNHAANEHHFRRAMPVDAQAMRALERARLAAWLSARRQGRAA